MERGALNTLKLKLKLRSGACGRLSEKPAVRLDAVWMQLQTPPPQNGESGTEHIASYCGMKRVEFWKTKITVECHTPCRLWRSIDRLLGRGSASSSAAVSADGAHCFFDEKSLAYQRANLLVSQ